MEPRFGGVFRLNYFRQLTSPMTTSVFDLLPLDGADVQNDNTKGANLIGWNGQSVGTILNNLANLRTILQVAATSNGQSTFTTSGYTVGQINVYLGGTLLAPGVDYNATDGTTIVLVAGIAALVQVGTLVLVEALTAYAIANAVPASSLASSSGANLVGWNGTTVAAILASLSQVRAVQQIIATSNGQSSFATTGYNTGFINVYLGGSFLLTGIDYTATDGLNIVLSSEAAALVTTGTVLAIETLGNFSLVNTLNASQLAASYGSTLIGYGTSTVDATLTGLVNSVYYVPDYATLRSYKGKVNTVQITGYTTYATPSGIAGTFIRDDTDGSTADNGGTVIVDGLNRRWKRVFTDSVSVTWFGAVANLDCSAAVAATLAFVKASNGAIRKIIFPAIAGGYQFANQVLFSLSNITYELFADWYNTSTAYVTPWVFANDLLAQPAAQLTAVEVIGHGNTWHANGKVAGTLAGYSPTITPSAFPAPMFNYIERLRISNVKFDDGMYDCLNLRQCKNHVIDSCEFSNAYLSLANGLNITTDWATFVQGDWTTYSHGVVRDCVAFNNCSIGMTYYNCSGGTMINCRSFKNTGSGYSYEAPPAGSSKYASGRFENCKSNNNGINGWYINQHGVIVDGDSSSYGNGTLGVAADTSGLQMCGVVVSGADKVTVLGDHSNSARHGVTFLGATGLQPSWECGGRYEGNAGSGINIQGLYRMVIRPGTTIRNNGNTLVSGSYSAGINVSNSSYNTNDGILIADDLMYDGNGAQAFNLAFVATVSVKNNVSYNDNASHGVGGSGFVLNNIAILEFQNNMLRTPNGNTSNAFVINNTVTKSYAWGNKSDQSSGNVMLNSASTKFGISGGARISPSTYTTTTTLPSTGTAVLNDVVNVLSTLLTELQDGVMQG